MVALDFACLISYYSYIVTKQHLEKSLKAAKGNSASVEEKMAFFSEECKRAGLKLTHQRLEIYRDMASCRDHPSAEIIYQRTRKRIPTISLDTIYRTLANFEAHGLIFRVQTVESQARFDAALEQHHHLICERCGKIADFEWKSLDAAPIPDAITMWGEVNSRRVALLGVCANCVKARR
jgi:Fur family transcriptional regulator, peroxide stress response regulator